MIFFIPIFVSAISVATVIAGEHVSKFRAARKAGKKAVTSTGVEPQPTPGNNQTADSTSAVRASKEHFGVDGESETQEDTANELLRNTIGIGLAFGGLFVFPLQLAGIICLAPTMAVELGAAWRDVLQRRRVTGSVLNSVILVGCVAGGFLFALNIGGFFLVLVRWLAIRTEDHSKREIIDLFGQQTRSVWLILEGVEVEVPFEKIQLGDLMAIHPGQMVPIDGVIVQGNASIDEHSLTGEAQPVEKRPGDSVLAGTMLLAGRISVRVEKTGDATTSAQIGRILADTSDYRATLVSKATKFNDMMALPWLAAGGIACPFIGMSRSLAFLWVSPGYRMTLFGPLSMLSFLRVAAKSGILIKDGRSLDQLPEVDTVVFDKTGTLTLNLPSVRLVHACPGFSEEAVLTNAAAAETKQHHPIARAILAFAAARGVSIPVIDDAACEIGYGVTVHIMSDTVHVGSDRFMGLLNISVPPEIRTMQDQAHNAGHSLVIVAINEQVAGALVLEPTIRPETQTIVKQLQKRGLRLYILSGDHESPTRQLAGELGMDGYFAQVLPEDKASFVKRLQAEGRKICFVGDGINDSIALKTANVSISLHGAATIAMDTAQIVLMDGDLAQLPRIFSLADEFSNNMKVNYFASTFPSAVIVVAVMFLGGGCCPR